jgi:hypothetical protein
MWRKESGGGMAGECGTAVVDRSRRRAQSEEEDGRGGVLVDLL